MAGDGHNTPVKEYKDFKFYTPEEMKGTNYWLYIYNAKEKLFIGRSRKRLGICLLFYLTFYLSLSFLWGILLYISVTIYTGNEGPWYILEESRIGGNPPIVHHPMEDIITSDDKDSIDHFNELLSRYQKLNPDNYRDCQQTPANPEDCYFDVSTLGSCAYGGSYGYNQNMPCVMLKLNKVYSWTPKVYNDTQDLPSDMPSSLKDYINLQDSGKRNMIWVSCAQRVMGPSYLKEINYWPGQGFPSYFYPFKGKDKHISPIVAVQFVSNTAGVSVRIECRAWAKDLISIARFTIIFK